MKPLPTMIFAVPLLAAPASGSAQSLQVSFSVDEIATIRALCGNIQDLPADALLD